MKLVRLNANNGSVELQSDCRRYVLHISSKERKNFEKCEEFQRVGCKWRVSDVCMERHWSNRHGLCFVGKEHLDICSNPEWSYKFILFKPADSFMAISIERRLFHPFCWYRFCYCSLPSQNANRSTLNGSVSRPFSTLYVHFPLSNLTPCLALFLWHLAYFSISWHFPDHWTKSTFGHWSGTCLRSSSELPFFLLKCLYHKPKTAPKVIDNGKTEGHGQFHGHWKIKRATWKSEMEIHELATFKVRLLWQVC